MSPQTTAARASATDSADASRRSPTRRFAIGLARAAGGAILFGVPMLMTMEMWQLGIAMSRGRLALLVALTLPLLVGLSHFSGFEETFDVREDAVDALVAWAVGCAASALLLALFGAIGAGSALREVVGVIALQAVPASMGALLAQSQLGREERAGEGAAGTGGQRPAGYASQVFLMLAGALFLAFNMAPTEEMVLIAYRLTAGHVVTLATVSLATMHAFVYAVEFSGGEEVPSTTPQWSVFLRYTVVGYAVALLACAYILWTFGRLDATDWAVRLTTTVVLGFPAAIGAAAARLIL